MEVAFFYRIFGFLVVSCSLLGMEISLSEGTRVSDTSIKWLESNLSDIGSEKNLKKKLKKFFSDSSESYFKLLVDVYRMGIDIIFKIGVEINNEIVCPLDNIEDFKKVMEFQRQCSEVKLVDLNQWQIGNISILMNACKKDVNYEVVDLLLNAGADLEIKDPMEFTAFMIACDQGQTEIVESLLKARANYKCQNVSGETGLILASLKGHQGVVKAIIEADKDKQIINTKDKKGMTALSHACDQGQTEVVESLLSAGAVACLQDNKGLTALDHANIGLEACGLEACAEQSKRRYNQIVNRLKKKQ